MNIEDILPELFGEKRVYYCQRCLNHGLREKRKNHKQKCLFRVCQCSDCMMVDKRRELNSRLNSIDMSSSEGGSSEDNPMEMPIMQTEDHTDNGDDSSSSKGKERRPNCQRCAQHNVVNRLKGHKRSCPYRDCFCPKCQVVVERQKLMADQIKLRRRQKREKNMLLESIQPTPEVAPAESSVCMKCAQQAFSYQQLMSILDPTHASDPLTTLATMLQACPHKS
ncbi:unnamed protein product [Auanema sp. JU1783]|nr:unnamed protein product [Auanema sp. JU1783]